MDSLWIAAIVMACLLAGALLGTAVRARLPEHHLSQDSIDVIKLATGLMATLAALVLGLLISSANTTRGTVTSEFDQGLADAAQIDHYLVAYGPETREARDILRRGLAAALKARWPGEDFGPREPPAAPNGGAL